tara:strand:+ start:373 stop:1095 length:723 start_codon:yes stop_codon:yes gene_type:complete
MVRKHKTTKNKNILNIKMSSNTSQVGYQWKPTTNKVVKQPRKDFSELNSNDETGISLCIRFVFKNITPGRVFNNMKNPTIILNNGQKVTGSLGFIERIDHIFRRDGNKTCFVHFRPKSWNFNNSNALNALEEMKNGNAIEIINDEHGHFWKVTISKAQRPEDAQAQQEQAQQKQAPQKQAQQQYEGANESDEEFQIYPDGPFAGSYNDVGEFPEIETEVSEEIAELTEKKQDVCEQKTEA